MPQSVIIPALQGANIVWKLFPARSGLYLSTYTGSFFFLKRSSHPTVYISWTDRVHFLDGSFTFCGQTVCILWIDRVHFVDRTYILFKTCRHRRHISNPPALRTHPPRQNAGRPPLCRVHAVWRRSLHIQRLLPLQIGGITCYKYKSFTKSSNHSSLVTRNPDNVAYMRQNPTYVYSQPTYCARY